MTHQELEEKLRMFRKEFAGQAELCDRLLNTYMGIPPMGEMTDELIENEVVGRKELFQIGFFQGVIAMNQASNPEATMHDLFKDCL